MFFWQRFWNEIWKDYNIKRTKDYTNQNIDRKTRDCKVVLLLTVYKLSRECMYTNAKNMISFFCSTTLWAFVKSCFYTFFAHRIRTLRECIQVSAISYSCKFVGQLQTPKKMNCQIKTIKDTLKNRGVYLQWWLCDNLMKFIYRCKQIY